MIKVLTPYNSFGLTTRFLMRHYIGSDKYPAFIFPFSDGGFTFFFTSSHYDMFADYMHKSGVKYETIEAAQKALDNILIECGFKLLSEEEYQKYKALL